ncbi:HAMP domain-containing sensor histidine kinase [Pseudoglutamicibacter cumminsii]|uniref:sensor histidine kinase n=1 Tax=Pseudoglutamicibacter cumminsii TaxID=156979 RepID=UPI0025528CAE|nr:HAMP domain-containing sensor histidine kinase [Pseudoglutamicibacter cumminsii]MDK7083577.1 HAMP domain-containing sensor histidine kinase [Pseudoglutamicibacter cumminsii]
MNQPPRPTELQGQSAPHPPIMPPAHHGNTEPAPRQSAPRQPAPHRAQQPRPQQQQRKQRRRGKLNWMLLWVFAPLVVGLVASLVWAPLDSGKVLTVATQLAWVPFILGLVATALLLTGWWAVSWLRRGEVRAVRKEREEQTQRRQRLMARLDHELKNPIQGIRAALADEPSQRQLDSIGVQAQRLSSLLSDLRKISEVEHAELEMTSVDLTELVEEAVQTVMEVPGARERHIEVALPRAPRPLPRIQGDSDLLFLAISNVLSNAVKYSEPGARIEIHGREADGSVYIDCADTGRGIAPDELETVWEELGRSREVRGTEGSGLGLPMVRAIIERHGGSTGLESWHGQGSKVTLRLPVG